MHIIDTLNVCRTQWKRPFVFSDMCTHGHLAVKSIIGGGGGIITSFLFVCFVYVPVLIYIFSCACL
jgi:hypothetical protein